jgi:hypothetical protein
MFGVLRRLMVTLDEVLAQVRQNGRVCPQPQQWQRLYEMLPAKHRKGAGWPGTVASAHPCGMVAHTGSFQDASPS